MATTIDGAAYDALAPSYDLLTTEYDHARWIAALLDWAREHGLRGRRALDVACGTGKSFVPLLEAGFEVIACDESRGMLAVAATKVPDPRAVLCHDMRSLPVLGSFDLITCIDDALNHLLSEDEVRDALASMARNLAPSGLLAFDVNTLATYRTEFAGHEVFEIEDHTFAWRGLTARDLSADGLARLEVDVLAPGSRITSVHRERHYPSRRSRLWPARLGSRSWTAVARRPASCCTRRSTSSATARRCSSRREGGSDDWASVKLSEICRRSGYGRPHPPMKKITQLDDPRYVKALSHPLRVRILAILEERTASPVQLSVQLGSSLGVVSYHVRTLERLGLIKLVRTNPVRGAVEHHYRAQPRPTISDESWAGAPPVAKQAFMSSFLQQVAAYTEAAAAAGGFDRSDAHFTRTVAKLDAKGWSQLTKACEQLLNKIDSIEAESAKRIAKDPHAEGIVDAGLVIMLFEAARLAAPESKRRRSRRPLKTSER